MCVLLGERVEPLLLVLVSIGKQTLGRRAGEDMGTAVERVLLTNRLPFNTLTLTYPKSAFPPSEKGRKSECFSSCCRRLASRVGSADHCRLLYLCGGTARPAYNTTVRRLEGGRATVRCGGGGTVFDTTRREADQRHSKNCYSGQPWQTLFKRIYKNVKEDGR